MTISIPQKDKDFFINVYKVVCLIPLGRVTSYGAIAKYLGAPRSSRMVGWAMNLSHKTPGIPAHRVVNRNGLLTGKMHFETPNLMQEKLESEGLIVELDQIQRFKETYWGPTLELDM
jgi:methylated-DNA-protein-cysteine methyltransferase-like protein